MHIPMQPQREHTAQLDLGPFVRRHDGVRKLCESGISRRRAGVQSTTTQPATETAQIRVLCMEDNELVADAIGRKLRHDARFEWLGWVNTGAALMSALQERKPHVVCMDLDMPGQDTVELIRDMRSQNPATRVLVLTGHLREEFVNRTVDAGAWGYISKAEESRVIVDSIHRVAQGEFVLGKLTLAECGSPPRRPSA